MDSSGTDDPEAINVLTSLKRATKELGPGLTKSFEDMSEFAHPNAAGVLGGYSNLDTKRHVCHFRSEPARESSRRVTWHLGAALIGLAVFQTAGAILDREKGGFVALCERELFDAGTWPRQVPYPRQRPRP